MYPLLGKDVFSVLWSDPSLYKEKPTIIDQAGLDARGDRAGWLPAVSYCSALIDGLV
jgi:hypothetical protein